MLALGGRRRRNGGLGLGNRNRRRRRLIAGHVAAPGQADCKAQQCRSSPKAAAYSSLAPSGKPDHFLLLVPCRCGLVSVEDFDLPCPEQLDAWASARFNPPAHSNPPIFE